MLVAYEIHRRPIKQSYDEKIEGGGRDRESEKGIRQFALCHSAMATALAKSRTLGLRPQSPEGDLRLMTASNVTVTHYNCPDKYLTLHFH